MRVSFHTSVSIRIGYNDLISASFKLQLDYKE